MRKLYHAPQRRNLAILPQPRVLRRDASFGRHGRGFYDCETWAALQDAAEVREVPGGEVPVGGGVLAHWGDEDAVLEGEGAEG